MQKLIVILGTNASGKSELGVRLARQFGGEIVSADSRQVYRGLDLGSGKISQADAAGIRHHLIDVVDPQETFSLAQFQAQAYSAIEEIAQRGKRPLLVGGTGLYISAIVEGYELVDVPPNETLRAELETLSAEALAQRLKDADPEAARRVDLSNPRRVIRALEIAAAGLPHGEAQKRSPRFGCLQLGLTWPREVLAERIERRLESRLASGMIEEVVALKARGVTDDRLDWFGLEYRFIARFLRREIPSLEELRKQLGTAILKFAKAQVTWFKRDKRILWLDPFGDYFQEACERIEKGSVL